MPYRSTVLSVRALGALSVLATATLAQAQPVQDAVPPKRPAVIERVEPEPMTITPAGKDRTPTTPESKPSAPPPDSMPGSALPQRKDEVFSDVWWGRTRPVVELHGYFRTRWELWNNFALSRHENAGSDPHNLWPNPIDHSYVDSSGTPRNVDLCPPGGAPPQCSNKLLQFTNMRFRISPEIHISDNLRILTQVDALDNLIFGSTPDSLGVAPGAGGYLRGGYNGYSPLAVFSNTQGPPTSGVNSLSDSIAVKRVWAEYQTPLGQLRFGRMPNHWGLGMFANAGDTIDSDWQSTVDRIMFVTGVKSLDLYFAAMWDYPASGITSQNAYSVYGGQPYVRANSVSVDQWGLILARKLDVEEQRLRLARGQVVVNGGLYTTYRQQNLDVASTETPLSSSFTNTTNNRGLEYRGAKAIIPDLWLQILWNKLRFEAEFATVYGEIANSPYKQDVNNPLPVRQSGLATQTEFRAIEDKLRVNFGFGWASGDPWTGSIAPSSSGLDPRLGPGPLSTFRFHPDYRIDLIFHRNIMSRVQGSYYFRPSVDYDFVRNANGQRFGIGGAIIWTRASEYLQTPGHKRDLGLEGDIQLYFQSRDGSLNDDPNKVGGFFSALQMGLFFPLGGLDYLPGQTTSINDTKAWELGPAFALRLLLGVAY